jgi:hypothetical protein
VNRKRALERKYRVKLDYYPVHGWFFADTRRALKAIRRGEARAGDKTILSCIPKTAGLTRVELGQRGDVR